MLCSFMKREEVEGLPQAERQHFTLCSECGEWFDRRDVREVFTHLEHEGFPPTLTLLETCPCGEPMDFDRQLRDKFVGVWSCSECGAQKWTETLPRRIRREEHAQRLEEFSDAWVSLDEDLT